MAVGSLYFAWRNRDFRKFLAGAFFVSSGILLYLYLANVPVPLLGTGFVETPTISAGTPKATRTTLRFATRIVNPSVEKCNEADTRNRNIKPGAWKLSSRLTAARPRRLLPGSRGLRRRFGPG